MAQLAIKGHATRGNEVIEILEMLGGENRFQREGDNKDRFYYIDKNKYIQTTCGSLSYTLFTLEEFLAKFPYKVGDEVLYKTYGIYSKIRTMLWNVEKERVFYRLESNKLFVATADELKPR
jgi:hypothetical protein